MLWDYNESKNDEKSGGDKRLGTAVIVVRNKTSVIIWLTVVFVLVLFSMYN